MIDLVRGIFSRQKPWKYGLILYFDSKHAARSVSFFEDELLGLLDVEEAMAVVTDRAGYHEILRQPAAARYAGVYYNLEGIELRRGGVFHPKLYLLIADDAMKVVGGSFNLTPSGFKRNVEDVVHIDISLDALDEGDADFAFEVRDFLVGFFVEENDLVDRVSPALRHVVRSIVDAPFFGALEPHRRGAHPRTAYFLDSTDDSILRHALRLINEPIESLEVRSPFYDATLDAFERIVDLCPKITFYVPSDGSDFPSKAFAVRPELFERFQFESTRWADRRVRRFIHAKHYRFVTRTETWDLVTSANFTTFGLLGGGSLEKAAPARNLETGFLIRATSSGVLLDTTVFQSEPVSAPDLIIGDVPHEPEAPSDVDEDKFLVEYATYNGEQISVRLAAAALSSGGSKWSLEVLLDGVDTPPRYSLEQSAEIDIPAPATIDGLTRIQVRLIAPRSGETSLPVNVSRLQHRPNDLPVLGASAFNDCVRIGGEEGLAEAYRLAQESGREDWLLYLLQKWPLHRILAGEDPTPPQVQAEDESLPSLKDMRPREYDRVVLSRNLELLLGQDNLLLPRLREFLDEIDKDVKAQVRRYNLFVFPILLDIAFQFGRILKREQLKRQQRPDLRYPAQTWLKNFRQYLPFAELALGRLTRVGQILFSAGGELHANERALLCANMALFFRLHTQETLDELRLVRGRKLGAEIDRVFPRAQRESSDRYLAASPEEAASLARAFELYGLVIS